MSRLELGDAPTASLCSLERVVIDLHEGNATGVVSAIDLLPEVYALECLTLLS